MITSGVILGGWRWNFRMFLNSSKLHLGLAPHGEGSVLWHVLDVDAVRLQTPVGPHLLVLVAVPLREAELPADEDLLPAGVLELVLAPDREKDLSNPDPSCGSVGLAISTPHSGLEPISSGTGQHFVDPQHVERMDSHPDVETLLATVLHKVLVAANPSRLKGLRRELLELIRDEMDREGELINTSPLPAQVKDPDLRVRDTTVEPTLGVGLVLAVAVALGRPPTHLGLLLFSCRSESSNKSLVKSWVTRISQWSKDC